MYIPEAFRESRRDVLHGLIRRYSFGTLVSRVGGDVFVTHLPFLLDPERGHDGTLFGHVARANPHWTGFDAGEDVLVIFQGPHTYVSPSWYQAPAAVPTWNYAAVHAYGRPRLITDPASLRRSLEALVATYESGFEQPWTMEQLPAGVVQQLLEHIVGFEIPISRLEGKLKLNQNRSSADRQGVVAALRRLGGAEGAAVADLMAGAGAAE